MFHFATKQEAIEAWNERCERGERMRLVDADWLIHEYYKNPSYNNLCQAINHAPTIDAVEVVRCKDCIHYESMICGITDMVGDDDDYCSYGVRKEGE